MGLNREMSPRGGRQMEAVCRRVTISRKTPVDKVSPDKCDGPLEEEGSVGWINHSPEERVDWEKDGVGTFFYRLEVKLWPSPLFIAGLIAPARLAGHGPGVSAPPLSEISDGVSLLEFTERDTAGPLRRASRPLRRPGTQIKQSLRDESIPEPLTNGKRNLKKRWQTSPIHHWRTGSKHIKSCAWMWSLNLVRERHFNHLASAWVTIGSIGKHTNHEEY